MTTSPTWKERWHEIIFEADTPAGKHFDVALLWAIAISVIVVMLESVPSLRDEYGSWFFVLEWVLTVLFSIEYILRIVTVKKPLKYILSFYGIIDLLSILPTFLGLFITGTQSLSVIRVLRFMRIFRVLKLMQFSSQASLLKRALVDSKNKILVFLFGVFVLVIILGTLMYVVESEEAGFTSIPRSIYWAIVTLTTVGFGDITPQTVLGQTIASIVMITGYAIIAIPTGIVTSEMASSYKPPKKTNTQACPSCSLEGHADDAKFCRFCGEKL